MTKRFETPLAGLLSVTLMVSYKVCHPEERAQRASRRAVALLCVVALFGASPATESQRLQSVVDAASANAATTLGARFGIAVLDTSNGAHASAHGDERFPLASTLKVPLAMTVLEQVDSGKFSIDQPIRIVPRDIVPYVSSVTDDYRKGQRVFRLDDLLERMVRDSDNTAADALYRIVGGAVAVNHALARAGVKGIVVRTDEAGLGRDYNAGRTFARGGDNAGTPNGYALLLVGLLIAPKARHPLSASTGAPLFRAMQSSVTGAGRLRAGLPPKTVLAHKTGTSRRSSDGAVDATNDAGLVALDGGKHNLIIVAFLNGARGTDAQNDAAIAALARAVVRVAR
jgi:beta-lactamase class A